MTQPTTTPTAEPVPSKRPQDLLFNAELLDIVMAGDQATVTDRNGRSRLTLAGATAEISNFNNRGNWVTDTEYSIRDIVLQSGTWYVCLVPHTSAGSFATDLSAKWRVHQGVVNDIEITDTGFATLQAAVTAAAGRTLRVKRVWDQTGLGVVTVPDETVVLLEASSHVTTATPNVSLFSLAGKHDSHVLGFGKLSQTGSPGASAYLAAVYMEDSVDCEVSGFLRFEGFQWCGVYMQNCTRCKAIGCKYRAWTGTVDNSAAVIIYQDCVDCLVDGIDADGTGWMGAYIQDPGGAGIYNPTGNKIINSKVRNVTAYAYMVYTGATGNGNNEISDNEADDIKGTAGLGQYGMPIYCVGFALGGLRVTGNKVSNGCQEQTVLTNGCAGIVITGMASGYKPAEVHSNSVDGMTQGNGIELVTMLSGVVLGPNDVLMPASNDGSGPGGSGAKGSALKIWNCLDVSMSQGIYRNLGTGSAITVLATDRNMTGINLAFGIASAVAAAALNVAQVGGYTITGSLSGGTLNGLSNTSPAAIISYFIGPVTGVTMTNGTTGAATPALQCSNSNLQFTGNKVVSTAAYSVSIGAGCTGIWDRSNSHSGRFENSASGFRAEVTGAGRPTLGIFQVGDRYFNTAPSAGEAESYRSLVAGTAQPAVIGVDWFPVGPCLPCTVAALTTPAAGLKGARGMATDANATTFAAVVASGGSNNVPVYCDGTNWRIG